MLEKLQVCTTPTPLQRMLGLEGALGCPPFFAKRDDLLGRGLGGNKLRKLEYIFAKAISENATAVISIGGFKSNSIALMAILARMHNIRPVVVLMGPEGEIPQNTNLAILQRLDVEIHIVDYVEGDISSSSTARMRVVHKVQELSEALKEKGESPYYVPEGGCCLEGSYSFYGAFNELYSQMKALEMPRFDIYLPVGSGSSYAGLWSGIKRSGADVNLVGISISLKAYRCRKEVIKAATRVCDLLGIDSPSKDDVNVIDEFIGEGYGEPTAHSKIAIELALEKEGILLDHTYTGKTLGAILELFSRERPPSDRPVVFWHTGGVPGAIDWLTNDVTMNLSS